MLQNKRVVVEDWGMTGYQEAWDRQEAIFRETVALKVANRTAAIPQPTPNILIFTEHSHVYTLGKSGSAGNLLLDERELEKKGAEFYQVNRGGDITYHGPGQVVGYPILDLDNFFTDIHRYLRQLEEAIIRTLADFDIVAGRYPGYTGVWIDADAPDARKICAMGVRCSRWVTMHGFALNVNTDAGYFKHIVPCGINDKAVTSMEQELGVTIDTLQVKQRIIHHLAGLFEMQVDQTAAH